MRRALRVAILGAALVGVAACGRSGPSRPPGGPGTLTVVPVTGAGTIVVKVNGAYEGACPDVCSFQYPAGATLELEAVGAVADFAGWNAGAAECGGTNPCEIFPSNDVTVGADWTVLLQVTITPSTLGRVVSASPPINCPGACTATIPYGSGVSLDAVDDDVFFKGWTGSCSGTALDCDIAAANADTTVTARFSRFASVVYGTSSDEFGTAVARDAGVAGGYVLVGTHAASGFTIGGMAVTHFGNGRNGYIARVGANGAATWTDNWASGVGSAIYPHSVDTELRTGNVLASYVAGAYTGSQDLDGDNSVNNETGDINAFVLRHDAGVAAPQWIHLGLSAGSNSTDRSMFADVDFIGPQLGLVGTISDNVTIAGQNLDTSNTTDQQIVTMLLTAENGSFLDAARHGRTSASHTEGTAVALLSGADIVTGGFYDSDMNDGICDPGVAPANAPDANALLFRLESDDNFGSCTWRNGVDVGGDDRLTGLTVSSDRVISAIVRVDGSQQVQVRDVAATNGAAGWTQTFTADDVPGPFGLEYDPLRDEVVVAGSFRGTITVGGLDFPSAGGFDVIVIRLAESDGTVVSAETVGGTGDDFVGGPDVPSTGIGGSFADYDLGYAAGAIAVLTSSRAMVTGWTNSPTFDDLTTAGGYDVFVLTTVP